MALTSAPIKAPPTTLCDWAELKALSQRSGQFRLNDLRRLWDKSREREETDPEGLSVREEDTDLDAIAGSDEDRFFDSIEGEIGERIDALGNNYPFRILSGSRLSVVGPPTEGGFMYLFCLFLSYANGKELLDGNWAPRIDNGVRDLFQACSTLAAAAEVNGCGISFGWPRPGNEPFLEKLKQVYEMFGEGRVVDAPRPGVSPYVKDEEIDVIAWRPRADRAAGTVYLLGQVASGENWEGKSIKGGPIDSFHQNWFTRLPPSMAMPAIFIPHAVPPVQMSGTRRERLEAITARFGTVFDRLRLPVATQDGLNLHRAKRPGIHIERVEHIADIGHWVNEQILGLQEAAN